MQHLDRQVIEQAINWSHSGETVWLCTVLATFGSAPRAPGAMLAVRGDGQHIGSLSGGCVEEDFLARLAEGAFTQNATTLRYGEGGIEGQDVRLPCGGHLDILVERLHANDDTQQHLYTMLATLRGEHPLIRDINLASGERHFRPDDGLGPRITRDVTCQRLGIRLSPAARLILAGASPVSRFCAQYAHSLGFEVILCDPREGALDDYQGLDIETRSELPSQFIACGECHAATAVVALTHDPRIDDLAMVEAVRTPAFYIGVMGSRQTSEARAERLQRSGGISREDLQRLHMPIGLALGSKTPAEIALAVMADILRVQRGRSRQAL